MSTAPRHATGLLGDTSQRNYAQKLSLFNAFADAELQSLMDTLELRSGMVALDAGCGTGEMLWQLQQRVGPDGLAVGIDLAADHATTARLHFDDARVLQADVAVAPLRPGCFDLVWCMNTLHHLQDPQSGLAGLCRLLKPGGRMALLQSALLPEMVFAWDSVLEQRVNDAVRRHYQQRYSIPPDRLHSVRALLGLARAAGLRSMKTQTIMIERTSPLTMADRRYFIDVLFRGTWAERIRPFLGIREYERLQSLCDPDGTECMLQRPDFHYLQSLTLVTGTT